jgi:hypothetical protein
MEYTIILTYLQSGGSAITVISSLAVVEVARVELAQVNHDYLIRTRINKATPGRSVSLGAALHARPRHLPTCTSLRVYIDAKRNT